MQVLKGCFLIRQIIGQSIRTKLELIEKHCKLGNSITTPVAAQIASKYSMVIKEAMAVDCLAHLLVNYIYKFYCVADLEHDPMIYHERLQAFQDSESFDHESNISFMKRCGMEMLYPSGKACFLLELQNTDVETDWLLHFGEASAFVAEIIRTTKNERLDAPRIFLTYHFNVEHSESFYEQLSQKISDEGLNVAIIRGRGLSHDIRWSILSRIWASDFHIVFIPNSWTKFDKTEKNLKLNKNWVNMELLYGRFIGKNLRWVVAKPVDSLWVHTPQSCCGLVG